LAAPTAILSLVAHGKVDSTSAQQKSSDISIDCCQNSKINEQGFLVLTLEEVVLEAAARHELVDEHAVVVLAAVSEELDEARPGGSYVHVCVCVLLTT
jgi:hypothetical protein